MGNRSNRLHRSDTQKDFVFLKVTRLCFFFLKKEKDKSTSQPQEIPYCSEASYIINYCQAENKGFLVNSLPSLLGHCVKAAALGWILWPLALGCLLALSFVFFSPNLFLCLF